MRFERWYLTSCPADNPAQSDDRRKYEAARQNERLARYWQRQGEGEWTRRMEEAAVEWQRNIEARRQS
jgi:hypothetical protein